MSGSVLLSHFSRVRLSATPWTIARQAPLSMGCSRQEYWSGLPCPPPGDLPQPGMEPGSPRIVDRRFIIWATKEVLKNPSVNARDIRNAVSVPGSGRSPGGGHGSPLQDSCLENPMDRGAWWATVYGVTKSWTWLSTHTHTSTPLSWLPLAPKIKSHFLTLWAQFPPCTLHSSRLDFFHVSKCLLFPLSGMFLPNCLSCSPCN